MKKFSSCFKGLLSTLRPLAGRVGVAYLVGLVDVFASLAFVWISKRVVDIATGSLDLPMKDSVVIMICIVAVQLLCRIFNRYWEGWIVVKAGNDIRRRSFSRTLCSVWDGRERFHSGDAVNRLEEDIQVVTDFICVVVPEFFVTLSKLVVACAYFFILAPDLAWYLVFIMPVAVLASRLFFKKLRKLTNEIREGESAVQQYMQENIQHRILLKTMCGTRAIMKKFGLLQEDVKDKTVLRLNYSAISRAFLNLGFMAGYMLAFLWGAYGIYDHVITYGTMVAFLQLVGQVQTPVANISRYVPAFIRALSSEERLMELDEQPQEPQDGQLVLEGAPGVRVSGLSFSYPGNDAKVLDGLDFDFKPGTMTAITGPTGAGKSTLVKLVMSLLRPSSGTVTLYSQGVEHGSDVSTRCNFMYVPQGNSLMSGTIRENLLLANPSADESAMKEALHLAAADFVMEMPAGLDTRCEEVGRGLSEGQAQRIAIARALLRPGGILILDEATSALDADTEHELLARLSGHFHGSKTILCITHRPAATDYADAQLRIS